MLVTLFSLGDVFDYPFLANWNIEVFARFRVLFRNREVEFQWQIIRDVGVNSHEPC